MTYEKRLRTLSDKSDITKISTGNRVYLPKPHVPDEQRLPIRTSPNENSPITSSHSTTSCLPLSQQPTLAHTTFDPGTDFLWKYCNRLKDNLQEILSFTDQYNIL